MRFDRRKLLQWMPAGLAALLAPEAANARRAAEPAERPAAPQLDGQFDVAIVGAGVAGCYVAYRLLEGEIEPSSPLAALAEKSGGRLKVGLFEYSGRIGGRLLSAAIPQKGDPSVGIGEGAGNPDTAARKLSEFGGFRFQPQMHIVRDLAAHLGLDDEPFPVDEPPENPVYLRGKRFLRGELAARAAELPYDLTPAERAVIAAGGDLPTYVANRAFAGRLPDAPAGSGDEYGPRPNGYTYLRTRYHAAFQAAEWETVQQLREQYEHAKQVASVDGRRLPDWSWWALMTRFLSSEGVAYVEDEGGYNNLWSRGNAPANLREDFYFADPRDVYPEIYGPDGTLAEQIEAACTKTAWRHIVSGYSDIPNRLYQGFVGKGGQAYLQHQLLGFDGDSESGYVLRFFQRESGTLSTAQAERRCREEPAACRTYGAKIVVLALPRRSLELLDQNNAFFTDPTVQQLLTTVVDVPATRFFLGYDRPWWTEAERHRDGTTEIPAPTCGRSTTDLRLRQLYYWHTASDGGDSFVLGSYTNGQANYYWRGLQNGPGPYDRLPGVAPLPDPPRADSARGHGPRAASNDMAKLAHRDLVEVVGPLVDGKVAPAPYYAHFQDWDKDPWGAGWHAWGPGDNDVTLIPRILQPQPGEWIYLCGESYSNVQGWVQGALNTSEVMLQKKLGLAYPRWLHPGGTWLGPGSEGIPTT